MYLFEQSGTEWKGCVEARPAPYNLTPVPPDPANPDTLFVPYFAPDEPGDRMNRGGNSPTQFNNSWLDDAVTGTDEERLRATLKYIDPAQMSVDDGGPLTIGPNRACPTPILPLSADFATVRTGIDAMNFWKRLRDQYRRGASPGAGACSRRKRPTRRPRLSGSAGSRNSSS